MSFRTIWIVIRGVNYAGQATKQATKDLAEFEKEQQRVAQQTRYMMFTGLLMVATAGIMGAAIVKLASRTEMGAMRVADFENAWESMLDNIGEAIGTQWGDTLSTFADKIEEFFDNEFVKKVIGGASIPVALVLGVTGISVLLSAGIATFLNYITAAMASIGLMPIGWHLAGSSIFLPVTAIMVVTLLYMLGQSGGIGEFLNENFFSPMGEAIENWKEDMREKAREDDIWARIIDAFGEWFFPEGSYGSWSGKQMGTRYIPESGPYMLHQGEAVVPTAGSIGSIGAGMASGGNYFEINVTQTIGTIKSEVDIRKLARETAIIIGDEVTNRLG